MKTDNVSSIVLQHLEKKGYHARIISAEHISELQQEIETQYRRGLFDTDFYSEELTGFDFEILKRFAGAKSLIVAAATQPQKRVTFRRPGNSYSFVVPPTYSYETDRQIYRLLEQQIISKGYQITKVHLPLKLLAVRCGLAMYGKNNITYIEGLGSFYRLAAFISDLPYLHDSWQEHVIMEPCNDCSACRKACPTDAIDTDRFLLHGERCLTFYNERRGTFPVWIRPSWHNSLVGCMYCQKACPMNRDMKRHFEEGPIFFEDETDCILRGTPENRMTKGTIEKLKQLDVLEYKEVLGRNLEVLLRNQNY